MKKLLILTLAGLFTVTFVAGGDARPAASGGSDNDLVKALEDANPAKQREAADELARRGPEAKDAVGALTKALSNTNLATS
jgi:hypothetical protein